jgi:hypothetical protein
MNRKALVMLFPLQATFVTREKLVAASLDKLDVIFIQKMSQATKSSQAHLSYIKNAIYAIFIQT